MKERGNGITVPEELLRIFEHPDVFDPDSHRVLFALRAVAQRVNDRANEWLAPLQLTVGKYNYLVALGSYGNRSLRLNEIAELIHTKSATVTQMIASLESDGLAERSENPLDGRSTLVKLTPRGRGVLREAMTLHHRNIESAMQGLPVAKRRTLFELLVKLGDCFAAPEPPAKVAAPSRKRRPALRRPPAV
jgi:DNA-binding MarR family transcriptional regulator